MAFDRDGTEATWNHGGTGEILYGQLVSGNLFPLPDLNPRSAGCWPSARKAMRVDPSEAPR